MSKKFDKFNYQSVESTHKGYQEVLVTFEYKKQPCHYYAFIKEKAKVKNSYYIEETKKEVKKMISNGQLEKRAKRYLNHKVKEEDRLVVTSNLRVKASKGAAKPAKVRKSRKFIPFLIFTIVGGVLLAGGLENIVYRFTNYGTFPEYVYSEAELVEMATYLYTGIALCIVGVALLAVFIPLLIKKLKLRKKSA